jgi:hypothetical protein
MLGWAFWAFVLLARFLRALWSTRRMIRDAMPLGPDWLPIDIEALRRAAGVRAPVRWAVIPKLCSSAVGGLVRPTVVIPSDLDDILRKNIHPSSRVGPPRYNGGVTRAG